MAMRFSLRKGWRLEGADYYLQPSISLQLVTWFVIGYITSVLREKKVKKNSIMSLGSFITFDLPKFGHSVHLIK